MTGNQSPEQQARDSIYAQLRQAGWVVQSAKKIDLNAGLGQAVREYQTDVGPADYVLFVDKKAVGVIEAKREEEGQRLTAHEPQTEGYAAAKLKWVNNKAPLPFLYESTGILTRFTDGRDPRPRSREVFSFHRPQTLREWLAQGNSLRERLQHIPPLNPSHLHAKELHLRDCQETAIYRLLKYAHGKHPVSGGHQEPRRTGRAGNDVLRADRRHPQVHRAVHRAAAQILVRRQG
jgi:type I restriction enzyme R subunit